MCVIDMLLSLFLKENMFRKKKNNLSQNGPGKGKRPMGGGSVALSRGDRGCLSHGLVVTLAVSR